MHGRMVTNRFLCTALSAIARRATAHPLPPPLLWLKTALVPPKSGADCTTGLACAVNTVSECDSLGAVQVWMSLPVGRYFPGRGRTAQSSWPVAWLRVPVVL